MQMTMLMLVVMAIAGEIAEKRTTLSTTLGEVQCQDNENTNN